MQILRTFRSLFALCFLAVTPAVGDAQTLQAIAAAGFTESSSARPALTPPIFPSSAESVGVGSMGGVPPTPQQVTPGADRQSSMECLATAIAYEAGNEPEAGKQAVAQVILNRAHHRAFPKTVCSVVYQGSARRTGCQFTFTCDGSMRRALSRRTWASAQAVAIAAMDGLLPPNIGLATHYHADYVMPRWAPTMSRIGQIGAHIFYRFPGRGAGLEGPLPGVMAERMSRRRRLPGEAPPVFMVWGLVPAPPTAAGSTSTSAY